MTISYAKLWTLLEEKGITKTQLRKMSGITTNALAKLGKDDNVSTRVLVQICTALNCDLSDIVELVRV